MADPELARSATAFVSLSETVTARLADFRDLVGADQFPRAFTDIMAHTAALVARAGRVQQAGAVASAQQLQRVFDGCTRHLQQLLGVLERVVPGGTGAGRKGPTKALKDVYVERDIPRIQKTLHGYEQAVAGMAI